MSDYYIDYDKTLNYLSILVEYYEKRYSNVLSTQEKRDNCISYLREKNFIKFILNKSDVKDIEKLYFTYNEIYHILNSCYFKKVINSIISDNEDILSNDDNNILDLNLF